MNATFWARTYTLGYVQRLVGRFDAHFQQNPIIVGERAYINLSFDIAPEHYRRFRALYQITQQPFFIAKD